MKNLYVVLIVMAIIMFAFFLWRPQYPMRRQPAAYVALLRDDLYFYPPRFPIPQPQLRPHEVPHARHFRRH